MISARHIYLLLCVAGTVVPYMPLIHWLDAQSPDAEMPGRFVTELFSTRIGAFFGLDVIVSALVLFAFMFFERGRTPRVRAWLPVAGTLLVGVSLGLPLYLYERERVGKAPNP